MDRVKEKSVPSGTIQGNSELYYNYKLATRLDDKKAAAYYLREIRAKGLEKNLKASINRMHPTRMMTCSELDEFWPTLSPAEQNQTRLAARWYYARLNPTGRGARRACERKYGL